MRLWYLDDYEGKAQVEGMSEIDQQTAEYAYQLLTTIDDREDLEVPGVEWADAWFKAHGLPKPKRSVL